MRGRFRELPGAGELGGIVRSLSDRLWERAPDDADFLQPAGRHGRAAVADDGQGGQRRRPRPAPRAGGRSPAASASSTTCRCPSTCSTSGGVGLAGPLASTRALARSMVVQAATLHSPTDLAVVALVGEAGLADWTFLKWLPHARSLGGSQLASTSHHALGLVNGAAAGAGPAAPRRRRRCRPCSS